MKKIIIAGFIVVLAATSFAIYHQTREFSGAAATNLAPCAQNSDCDSGHCSHASAGDQGVCCSTGACGWGDGNINLRECVASGQTRESDQMSLVCRNGVWKTRLNGWGCDNPGPACDQGICQQIGTSGVSRCVECSIDPGISQGCANGETCPQGTICSNTVCCPSGYCGWGEGWWFTRHCIKDGEHRENRWARLVCRNGIWKTELNGWGCNALLATRELAKTIIVFLPAICFLSAGARNRSLLRGNLQKLFGAGKAVRHCFRPMRRLAELRRLRFGADLQCQRPVRFFVHTGNMRFAGQGLRFVAQWMRRHIKLWCLLLGPDL